LDFLSLVRSFVILSGAKDLLLLFYTKKYNVPAPDGEGGGAGRGDLS